MDSTTHVDDDALPHCLQRLASPMCLQWLCYKRHLPPHSVCSGFIVYPHSICY